MDIPPQIRWIAFGFAVPASLYDFIFGIFFMGFCPGLECWPHTFAWLLLAPCLLLAIWSLRATAIAAVLLLAAHVYTDAYIFHAGLTADTLWNTDMAMDLCLWLAVLLLIVAAILPGNRPRSQKQQSADSPKA